MSRNYAVAKGFSKYNFLLIQNEPLKICHLTQCLHLIEFTSGLKLQSKGFKPATTIPSMYLKAHKPYSQPVDRRQREHFGSKAPKIRRDFWNITIGEKKMKNEANRW